MHALTPALLAALQLVSAAAPDGILELPLRRIKDYVAYGIEVDIGTPPQKNIMFIDTGSATTGLEEPNNPACKQGSCKDYGFYDNTTSSTSAWVDDKYFDLVGDRGTGSHINDTVTLGGHTVPSLEVGILHAFSGFDQSTPQAGIFGLGAVCRDDPTCRGYPSTLQQLADRNLISRRAFSLYLGPNVRNATGELLLGGVDTAKRGGPVHTLPMKVDLSGQPNNVEIHAITLRRADGNNVTAKIPAREQKQSVWDSGNPEWEIPQTILDAALTALGNPDKKKLGYAYEIDCKYRETVSKDVIVSTFAGGFEIEISLDRLVGEYDGERCVTWLSNGGTAAYSMGDEFLRNVYTTFDYDAKTISFGKVKYTDKRNVKKL